MPTLRIKLPEQGEITHELAADRVTVGRRPDNTIQIIDRSVSAHHAELILEDGHYRLHDLGSTNLSFVDGSPVTDFHLHHECRVAFGTVQCEFDPHTGAGAPRMSVAQLEKDLAFLRGENADLNSQIQSLQRQIDILSSARLVTKKADNTPFAAANDTLKAIVAERDDLRHLTTGLKLELEKLREELLATSRERDAARQACELLQAEKVTHSRELQDLRQKVSQEVSGAPAEETHPPTHAGDTEPIGVSTNAPAAAPKKATPAPAAIAAQPSVTIGTSEFGADVGSTQKISLPPPAAFQAIAGPLKLLSFALGRLQADITEKTARAQIATQGSKLSQAASPLGGHPIVRLSLAIEAMLQDCAGKPDSPDPGQIQTLLQATDLISRLMEPSLHDRAKTLPHPKVLAVDEDNDLLHTMAASLELAHLPTTTCSNSQQAQTLIEKEDFDLLLVDARLPADKGPSLSERIRESSRNNKKPVIFLTPANTLEHPAQSNLSGGHEFLPKPFNTTELTVKAETLIWKGRFGLL